MLIVVSNLADDAHETPSWHPERPERGDAVLKGFSAAGLDEAIVRVDARPATAAQLLAVHDESHVAALEQISETGGGAIDADTFLAPGSWNTAKLAAGAGIVACEQLLTGAGDAAFVVARPPGHHARRDAAMGFCLVNSIAVTAAALVEGGERVLIVDWDVHHGNGTQDIFWNDPRVFYASLHGAHLFPGTGRWDEIGGRLARGTNLNIPLRPGATGDVMLAALDEILTPQVERFEPSWVLVSAGFDAHRDDPLADLSLTATDFALMAGRVRTFVPRGRVVMFLEGGYDLAALGASAGAAASGVLGRATAKGTSSGGPGRDIVEALATRWSEPFWQ